MACSVVDCDREIRSGGLCYAHYMKKYRYGTPTPTHAPRNVPKEDLTGRRFGALLAVKYAGNARWQMRCDCGRTVTVLTGDLNAGTTRSCGDGMTHRRHLRSPDAEYSAAHARVRRERGSAWRHACIDCGDTAADWSYSHGDPDELTSSESASLGLPYSLDQRYYEPRCRPCHRRYDAPYVSHRLTSI